MTYVVPVIKGDGIDPEIVETRKTVLEATSDALNFGLEWREYPYCADHYLETVRDLRNKYQHYDLLDHV